MKRLCQSYILLTALFIIAGCAQETDFPVPGPLPASRYPISWNVKQVQTRALVNDNSLRESCKVKADGTNETIGIWGQYTMNQNGQNQTKQEFTATKLFYGKEENENNTLDHWYYTGEIRYWQTPAVYDFRACYPQKLMP